MLASIVLSNVQGGRNEVMRIRVIQKPTSADVDGIRLDLFQPGVQYDVGNTLGALFLAEGWAEPAPSEEAAVLIPLSEFGPDRLRDVPPNLQREFFPPYYDAPAALAADRRHTPRRRRRQ
jgi:hypothetical protein